MYALNEIQMLAQKAARGGGAHPAQAAHFGRAVLYHLAAHRAPEDVLDALASLPAGPIQSLPFAPEATPLGQSYMDAMAGPDARPNLPVRLTVAPDMLARLEALAQRTYVPATDASRSAGAGAGLTDND